MEGIFFYWFMWVGWVVITFLMRKSKMRIKLGIFIMFTVLISKYYVVVGSFHVRMSLLMFLFLGYYLMVNLKGRRSFTMILMTLTLTFAYSGVLLFRIYDPVWFFFDYRLLVSVGISILAIYLGKQPVEKFALFIISVCQGEFLFWLILGEFHEGLTIGTAACLDILVIGCFVIYLWMKTQQMISYVEQNLQKPVKEKQG